MRRIEAVLQYANEQDLCRSRLLLNYFGETASHDCGLCDTCIARRKRDLETQRFRQLEQRILQQLDTAPCSINTLVETLNEDEDQVMTVVRQLLDTQKIVQDQMMRLARRA